MQDYCQFIGMNQNQPVRPEPMYYVSTVIQELELPNISSVASSWIFAKSLSFNPYYYRILEVGVVDTSENNSANQNLIEVGIDIPESNRIVISKSNIGLHGSLKLLSSKINSPDTELKIFYRNQGNSTDPKCRIFMVIAIYQKNILNYPSKENSLGTIILEKEITVNRIPANLEIKLPYFKYDALYLRQFGFLGPNASSKWPIYISCNISGKTNFNGFSTKYQIENLMLLSSRSFSVPPIKLESNSFDLSIIDARITGDPLNFQVWAEFEYYRSPTQ